MPNGSDQGRHSTGDGEHERPTITIYQNPDHVAGIVQQLFDAPLVTDESREQGSGAATSDKADTKGHGGLKGSAQVPLIGEVSADLSGDRGRAHDSSLTSNAKTVQNFKYSQAYYLHLVRGELRRRGLTHVIANAADAENLTSGDWVEFEAAFRPSALHALLDILTPDLIAAIADRQVRAADLDRFPEFSTVDQWKVFYEGIGAKAKLQADISRAIAQAVRVDFRVEKTREFYGAIDDVTAITICDNAHFSVQDEDRILDGAFHVLGKVTSSVERDVPILSRNKLLDRISPELVDKMFSYLREQADTQVTSFDFGDADEDEIANVFDLALPSRITGASFKVVPVAIFA